MPLFSAGPSGVSDDTNTAEPGTYLRYRATSALEDGIISEAAVDSELESMVVEMLQGLFAVVVWLAGLWLVTPPVFCEMLSSER